MKASRGFTIGASLLVLSACGGGGGGDPVVVTPPTIDSVPDSASASTAAMKSWLTQVAATAPDDKEALAVARFAPPQPDDTEPESLQ